MKTSNGIVLAALLLSACGGGAEEQAGEAGQTAPGTASGDEGAGTASADGETMTFTTEDGSATVRTGGSGTAIGGLPPYPGARTQGSVNIDASNSSSESGQIVTFQTGDPPDRVIAFYREALESRGYEITMEMTSGQMQAITATTDDGESGVNVSATATGTGETVVSLIAGSDG
jgi:hypothetical protein